MAFPFLGCLFLRTTNIVRKSGTPFCFGCGYAAMRGRRFACQSEPKCLCTNSRYERNRSQFQRRRSPDSPLRPKYKPKPNSRYPAERPGDPQALSYATNEFKTKPNSSTTAAHPCVPHNSGKIAGKSNTRALKLALIVQKYMPISGRSTAVRSRTTRQRNLHRPTRR